MVGRSTLAAMDHAEAWPRGANPHPNQEWQPRGATPHPRSGGAAVRRYPSSKVRSSGCWSSREEIPHVQGKRNPSKTVLARRCCKRASEGTHTETIITEN